MAIEILKLRAGYAESGKEVGYFVNDAAEGQQPHFAQITDDCKDEPDVFPLFAAPVAASSYPTLADFDPEHPLLALSAGVRS